MHLINIIIMYYSASLKNSIIRIYALGKINTSMLFEPEIYFGWHLYYSEHFANTGVSCLIKYTIILKILSVKILAYR